MHATLRAYIRQIVENETRADALDPELTKIINSYVNDPRNLSWSARQRLAEFVSHQRLKQPTRIERIEARLPDVIVGDVIEFDLSSFSTARFTQDQHAGHIAWKSSDRAISVIEHATRGWSIDYSMITAMFDADSEREVLITGRYVCKGITRITEPGTYEPYGYKIPLYSLQEL